MDKFVTTKSESSSPSPFQRFPRIVWEEIFDKMDNSKDIVTVLRTFPKTLDLNFYINQRKRCWLIDQVLPFLGIGKQISLKDILNCRLVCKQWQLRTDYFLQNQPYYRAYDQILHKEDKNFWNFLDYYERELGIEENYFYKIFHLDSRRCNFFQDHHSPIKRNPFIFRHVGLALSSDLVEHNDPKGHEKLLDSSFKLMDRFGGHIWYLWFPVGGNLINPPHGLQKTLIWTLQRLPNLKTLCLSGVRQRCNCRRRGATSPLDKFREYNLDNSIALIEKEFPVLPMLECIEIEVGAYSFQNMFITFLLARFAPQIRRLSVTLDRWNTELLKQAFPCLTELDLEEDLFDDEEPFPVQLLLSTLENLIAPNLVRLCISMSLEVALRLQISDILKWLKRFSFIKYFKIHNEDNRLKISEEGWTPNEDSICKDKIPSLEQLLIADSLKLSYSFLLCFPSLRHLTIWVSEKPVVTDLSMPDSFVKIREQLQTGKLYESNVWEHLCYLNTITLLSKDGYNGHNEYQVYYKFDRETYERMKKAGRTTTTEFSNLRNQVFEYVTPDTLYYHYENFYDSNDEEMHWNVVVAGDEGGVVHGDEELEASYASHADGHSGDTDDGSEEEMN